MPFVVLSIVYVITFCMTMCVPRGRQLATPDDLTYGTVAATDAEKADAKVGQTTNPAAARSESDEEEK